jgi:hypothetical protein
MEETAEVPFYFKMEKMTIEEIINLKKALDDNKKVGGVNFQAHIVTYMQLPQEEVYSGDGKYGPKFFKDMKNLGVDAYKGDWFV